ncbi:MAG: nitroreductase family deazaflavin-dependent oxidoreductase [Gordonia sp.]|nr:nitroreductase family deazaflavin-dependent oxidoreductase [Gordonia rubripertincta]MBA4020942.1 nitroreductase family deazaflavin-dependent oxidoreductase [Gordonia sp. (in: high G+C Gram-positive bacteria)]
MDSAALVARFAARTATIMGDRGMRIIARVNKSVTNRVVIVLAKRAPHMAVIEHLGRRSGRSYETPVMVFVSESRLAVVLNYGTESDWVRNVVAAGHAEMMHRNRRFHLDEPRVVPASRSQVPLRSDVDSGRQMLTAVLTPGSDRAR